MRDKTHDDFIERWAEFVKNNPIDKWKPVVRRFINAQFRMNQKFLQRLKKTKNGREKIIKLYNIKNLKGYEGLLN